MKFKTLAATAALTLATGAACAADQSVGFTGSTASFSSGTSNVLQGGDDVITFTGLAAGTYDFLLTLSAQYVSLGAVHLNGVAGTVNPISSKITFASVEGVRQSPFTLTLAGSTSRSSAQYSGELSVTAVPEPESYALMLAGLGVLAFVARRRRTDA